MKILHCQVQNFGSYKHLEFSFDEQGLTLISGPTGSGKSTLCDVVPWILFGKTSKGGTVDEVVSWNTTDATEGELTLKLSNGNVQTIKRIRTKKSQDLYYDNGSASRHRGKDINDTQKQINQLLGFDYDLYMSGAYYHEFSHTASFFTANAKIRRQITEQLVDLSLAKKLSDNSSEYKKALKKELEDLINNKEMLTYKHQHIQSDIIRQNKLIEDWYVTHNKKCTDLQEKYKNYKEHLSKQHKKEMKKHQDILKDIELRKENTLKAIRPETDLEFYRASIKEEKRQIELTGHTKCPACGSVKTESHKLLLLSRRESELKFMETSNEGHKRMLSILEKDIRRHNEDIPVLDESVNPYLEELESIKDNKNPHLEMKEEDEQSLVNIDKQIKKCGKEIKEFETEYDDIEILIGLTSTFRSVLVKNTITDLENQTNKILNDHFDAEIQVQFTIEDNDKLDVLIRKDGNECSYTQLSKGQRQLLKMSFAVSVMTAVQNHHGVSFNALFLDEFTDGCDEQLKVKAYDLLQELSLNHSSVFVVEHNESLKAMFSSRYDVLLTDKGSQIEAS